MIGNDIVDLSLAFSGSRCREKRFWEKVLLDSEWDFYGASDKDLILLWACWAAKESAYKLERRAGRSRRFCPKDYLVERKQDGTPCRIHGKHRSYRLQIEINDFLHAKCWQEGIPEPDHRIYDRSSGLTRPDLPWKVLVRRESGALSGGLYNTGPYFPVSKSHHGRFQAYAWLATESQYASRKAD